MAKCKACGKLKIFSRWPDDLCPKCAERKLVETKADTSYGSIDASLECATKAEGTTDTNAQSVEPMSIAAEILPKKNKVKVGAPKVYRVTGMSHYESNLLSLAVEDDDFDMTKKDLIDAGRVDERISKYFFPVGNIEVIPEPENPVDPKAIKVVADGMHIGYIKAGSCAHLLKVLREDRIKKIEFEIGGGPYKRVSEEYDADKDRLVYTLEKGTVSYYVHLSITEE